MGDLRDANAGELERFLDESGGSLLEEEALLVLENGFCTAGIAQRIAQDARLTSWYTVRLLGGCGLFFMAWPNQNSLYEVRGHHLKLVLYARAVFCM